ncbi:MAG: hypothetical protein Q8P71_02330 [bacterium]|nr:hypothetical protein [bacterium]
MNEDRKGQIAFLLVKHQLRKKGVRLTRSFRREVGNEAKAIGIPIEEAMEFVELIVRELVEETFSDYNVREGFEEAVLKPTTHG